MRRFSIGSSALAVVVLSFATFLCRADSTHKTEELIKPLVIWTGPLSQILTQSIVRIDNEKQWKKVWLEHLGKTENQAFADSDRQFQIDFDRCEVIAIFRGAGWNSRGIRFEEIHETGDKIRIRYDSISYQTSGVDGGGVKVASFAFMVFPTTSKAFLIQENTQGLKDHPSKWTERAELMAVRSGKKLG